MLLDYHLTQKGITKEVILGYEREEFTHLNVAVAIASGSAEDLAIPREFLGEPLMKTLITVVQGEEFKEEVVKLGGYDVRDTGKLRM